MSTSVKYRRGYKYQLHEDFWIRLTFQPPYDIVTDWIKFDADGLLLLKNGYAWDGPSGPTKDSRCSIRGSLVHDAGYQLMRENYLSRKYRELFDNVFRDILVADGMSNWRAWLWWRAVRKYANFAADPANSKPVLTAP